MDQGGLEISLRRNSTWTPKNHKPSREKVFQERLTLIDKWYSGWNKQQRRELIEHLLVKCTIDQLQLIDDHVHPQLPIPHLDFTKELPRYLCLKVLSYLDPRSLCRATQVSWYWHYLTEENCIWKPKCLRFGWTLPSPPLPTDVGTWKRHYISCVRNLHWVPPPPVDTSQQQETHGEQPVVTSNDRIQPVFANMITGRKKPASWMSRKHHRNREGKFSFSQGDTVLQERPIWRHPDRYPQNIAQSTILTTSLLTNKHTGHCHHPTANLHTFSPNTSQEDSQDDKHSSTLDEDLSTDSDSSHRYTKVTFPRMSTPLNNLPNKGRVFKSDMYNSLLRRTGAIQDSIVSTKEVTSQQNNPSILLNKQLLRKETENTVELAASPWLIRQESDCSDNEI